jgi:hypothetical protein
MKGGSVQMKGVGGDVPIFLGEMNQSVLFWGKGSTMHFTSPQAATVNLLEGSTSLFSA